MTASRILVIGSANIDLVAHAPHCVRPGESLIGRAFETVCGGKGANQAVAAARLGASTYFAGCVGNDAFGEMQRRSLAEAGVDVSHLKSHPNKPTGTALICVADDGQNSIVVVPSANLELRPADIDAVGALFAEMDAVLLQLEIPLDTVQAALDMARRYGVVSILDAGPAQAVPEAIVRAADVVSPNETEAEAMTGITVDSIEHAREAAEALSDLGAREVVIKLGAQGALYHGHETFHVPAFRVSPVDTTAAGDAFTAALALNWRSLPRREALRVANAVGALATTAAGAQPSMPTRDAVERFLMDAQQ
ncbi:MAG TPA: ribokinase [Candidatus Hydrogenedentes bacterium]|nr:ribokinase [Candidatus Hydrogenedentota bacterium]HPG68098.1 ribokinase [Candidatus Hydrogenedentota bacterium]